MSELSTLPEFELRNFARWVAKEAIKYFEDPEVQERFEKWKKEEEQKEKEQANAK